MAFGITRAELNGWKEKVSRGEVAFLTHYWLDDRFPDAHTVTKAGCNDKAKLIAWGEQYGLKAEWIDARSSYPHFDLLGEKQIEVLRDNGLKDHIQRFKI